MEHVASFNNGDATPANVALGGNELFGRGLPTIIGTSAALRRVLAMVRVVAPTDATVLISGETGTGKELIAEAIHKCSSRSGGPFVKVNCAAIPEGLLESELFGHERGAYTGAVARGIGRFERANRGTLFLDEIGDLPLELQPKLLRVMQERQFERLGGVATIGTDVRVICATHRNLVEMVDERQFRPDLFYRLSVFPI
jgi:formate hydrogenlyase transcriptional activator